uniref:Uncharacterized protein n=1 Tax=Rhizophora mucronata TaxID=61149 RepID=A0A2P2QFC0_RHIMU
MDLVTKEGLCTNSEKLQRKKQILHQIHMQQ